MSNYTFTMGTSTFTSGCLNRRLSETAKMARKSARLKNYCRSVGILLLLGVLSVTKSYAANSLTYSGGGYAPGTICEGSTVILQTFQLVNGTTAHSITDWTFTTAGTYVAGDITGFAVYKCTSSSYLLAGATQLGATVTTGLGTGTHTATSFTGVAVTASSTTYYIIVATLSATAVSGHTINISAMAAGSTTVPLTIATGTVPTPTGAITVGGTGTIATTPAAITGTFNVCAGSNTTLSDATSGGTWSSVTTSVATAGGTSTTDAVYGVAAGTSVISYTLGSCAATQTVTVGAVATGLTGATSVCAGSTTTLSVTPTTATGGTWSSSATGTASVSTAGVVKGVAAGGPVTISYTTPGCSAVNSSMTVNAVPNAITGNGVACIGGSTVSLSSTTPGGTWSSISTGVATISSGGAVTGLTQGTSVISYVLSGCAATTTASVTTTPATITGGAAKLCYGTTETLGETSAYGGWTVSGSTGTTVSAANLLTAGSASGLISITYTNTCGASGAYTVQVGVPTASLPYTQGFESSWINGCNTSDIPADGYWVNTPSTGNDSWRREDDADGANTAAWTVPTDGQWWPVTTEGSNYNGASSSHAARFHTYEATSGTTGTLDLYVNLPAGSKQISFDYTNTDADVILFEISTNNGTSFTTVWTETVSPTTWMNATITTTLTATSAILRWSVTSDFGDFDQGIDNVSVAMITNCTTGPTGVITTASPSTYCTTYTPALALSGVPAATSGYTYQWKSGTGGTYSNITGATNATYTPTVSATTNYECTIGCSFGGSPATSSTVTASVTSDVVNTFPYTENFDELTAPALPCGWTVLDVNADGDTWTNYDDEFDDFTGGSTPNYAECVGNFGSAAMNDWLITVPIATIAGYKYRLTFSYASEFDDESMSVYYGNNNTVAAMTHLLYSNSSFATEDAFVASGNLDFTASSTGNIYYGFYVNTSAAADAEGVYIDNIEVQQIAPCSTPVGAPSGVSCSAANGITTSVTCTPPGTLPDSFLIVARVATVTGAAPTPVNGVNYAIGASSALGTGCYVIGYGAATSSTTTLLTYATAGLANNTAYNIYEYSYNDGLSGLCGGPSYYSTPGTSTFTTCVTGPAAPTTGGTVTPLSVPISWATVGGATGYTINGYTNSSGTGVPALTSGLLGSGVTSYTFTTGITGGITYYFFVTASTASCGAVSTGLAVPVPYSVPYYQGFEVGSTEGNLSPNSMQGNTAGDGFSSTEDEDTYGGEDDPSVSDAEFGEISSHLGSWEYLFQGKFWGAGLTDNWLVGPPIYLTAGATYTFSFYYATDYGDEGTGTTYKWTTLSSFLSSNGTLPSNTSTTMSGTPITLTTASALTNTTYTHATTTFSVSATGTYYFGILGVSNTHCSYLMIDDIAICQTPTGLTASASPNPVSSGCNDVNFNATTEAGYTYSWTGGLTAVQTPSLNATFSSTVTPTTYSVTVSSDAANSCTAIAAVTLSVSPSASDAFSYASSPYCSTSSSAPAVIAGTSGGGFTATPVGLSFSSSTGAVNPSLSTPGTYIVTYSVAPVGCTAVSTTQNITINAPVYTSFNYPGGPYCTSTASLSPTFTGSGVASLFSSTPSGLSITPSTGVIDLATSAANTYTVTNTSTVGGCGTNSTTATVAVNQLVAITTQPVASSVLIGGTAMFSVVATGTGPLTYQWYENNGTTNTALTDGGTMPNYSGSTTSALTISSCPGTMNTYVYTCIVGGASPCASVTSDSNGILSVSSVAYTLQPTSVSLCPAIGSSTATATFTSGTTGAGTTDVWQENQGSGWNDLSNGTVGAITYSGIGTGTLTLTGVSASNNGWQYRRNLNEASSPIISNVATLTVNTPITVVTPPVSAGICSSGSGTFSVSVTGTSPTYTWQASLNGTSWTGLSDGGYYTGSSTNVLTVSNPVSGMNNFQYQCIISGSSPCGAVTAGTATLTVNAPAAITSSPSTLTLCTTGLGTFNVSATGTGLTYQWQYSTDGITYYNLSDGGYYSGSATSALSINSPVSGMNGFLYRCAVTGTCNTVNSSPATLNVNTSPLSVTIATPAAICLGAATTVSAVATCSPSTETQTVLGMNFSGGTGTGTAAFTGQAPVGGVWSVTSTNPTQTSPWTVYANGTGTADMNPTTCSPGTHFAGVVSNGGSTTITSTLTSPVFSMPAGTTAATLSFGQYYLEDGDIDVEVQYTINGGTTWNTIVNYAGTSVGSSTAFTAESYALITDIPAGTASAQVRFLYKADNAWNWCINAVQIVATVTPVYAYTWSGPGTISNTAIAGPSVTPTVSGSSVYNVVLTASNFTTCNAAGSVTVTANPLPATQNVTSSITGYGTTTLTATPSSLVCASLGSTMGMANSVSGINYKLYDGATLENTVAGSGSAISFGPYTSTGTYTVQAANATTGCTSPMTGSVVVYTNPTAGVVSSSGSGLCTGGSVTLSQSSAGAAPAGSGSGISQYTWQGPGLLSTTTGTSLSVSSAVASPTATATGAYSLIVTYPIPGCTAQTVSPTVTIAAQPTLTFAATPSSVCVNTPISVSTSTSGGAGTLGYSWSGPGIATATGSSVPSTFTPTVSSSPGVFTVTANYSGSGCIAATQTQSVTVDGNISASAFNSGPICIGAGVNLTSSASGGSGSYTYSWTGSGSAGLPIPANTASLSATPTASGAQVYTLTVSSSGGCNPVNATTSVTVNTNQQWSGTVSTAWSNASNWTCGIIPNASQNVVIPGASSYSFAPSLDISTGYANNLTLNATAALSLGSNQLDASGNVTNNGTVSGAGVIYLNGSSSQTLSGNGVVSNLTLANSSGATINASTDTVSITGTLLLNSGTLTTGGSHGTLMLVSNSSGSASIGQITGGAITGNVVIQQYIPGGRRAYRFVGHPFSASIALSQIEQYIDITGVGGATNGFTTTTSEAPSAYWYNTSVGNSAAGTDPGWTAFTSTNGTGANSFNQYEGIRLFFRGAKGEGLTGASYTVDPVTYRMTGPVNTGTQSISMVKGTGANEDYNLIGNPYPSIVDVGTAISSSSSALTGGFFYVWNPYEGTSGQFVTRDIGVPYNMGANESFEVRTAANGNVLTFTEANKTTVDSAVLMRTASADNLDLNIYDNTYHLWDMLIFRFNDGATDNEDARYDGAKPPSPASLNFYSWSADNVKLAADVRPFTSGKVIPLGISSSYAQEFIMKADNLTLSAGERLYLHDKYLQTYTQLQQGTEYKFSITKDPASQGDARFELSLNPSVAAQSNGLDVQMVPNPANSVVTISYTASSTEQTSIRVMNVEGITVLTQDLGQQQSGSTQIALDKLASGVYMVEFTSGTNKVVHRLVKE